MKRRICHLLILASLFLLAGCASLQPRFETPSVSLTSFRIIPSESMAPRFEFGLHVVNPNLVPLTLKGLSYSVKLEGHQIITGATNDLPAIDAYGEGDLTIEATADLLSGLRLLSELMARPRETFTYELEAKLDPGNLLPSIRIKEKGEIMLKQSASR
jgi:LEA14-like dessication related protein